MTKFRGSGLMGLIRTLSLQPQIAPLTLAPNPPLSRLSAQDTRRLQYPLIKEYTLNHIVDPSIV